MANVILNEEHLTNIANAIRSKKGTQNNIYPRDMASEISAISTGVNTSDATAIASNILSGKTAYISNGKTTGTMKNNGKHDIVFSNIGAGYYIPEGYHNGTGYVSLNTTEKNKLIPENIKSDVTILGVTGNLQTGVIGKQVKTGTTSSPTINTGLNSIERFILYSEKIVSVGLMSLAYFNNSATITFCGEYNSFLQTCKTIQHNSFSISGGTFSWTDSAVQYKFMSGSTYTWIAIGT